MTAPMDRLAAVLSDRYRLERMRGVAWPALMMVLNWIQELRTP